MKQLIIILSVGLLVLVGCGKKADHDHPMDKNVKMNAMVSQEDKFIYYTCPMESHKHIHSREAGNCTECGMKMVKAVITAEEKMEYWGCPMESHGHVRKEQAGTCDDCGMKLKPMRLEKS